MLKCILKGHIVTNTSYVLAFFIFSSKFQNFDWRKEVKVFMGNNIRGCHLFFGEEGRKLGVDAIPPQK